MLDFIQLIMYLRPETSYKEKICLLPVLNNIVLWKLWLITQNSLRKQAFRNLLAVLDALGRVHQPFRDAGFHGGPAMGRSANSTFSKASGVCA